MKKILLSVTLLISVALLIWLFYIMPHQAYAICEIEKDCKFVAKGWYVIRYLWPIAVFSIVIALIITVLIYEMFYEHIERKEWTKKIVAAERRANESEKDTETRYLERIRKVEIREEMAYEQSIDAEKRIKEAQNKILEVKKFQKNCEHRAGMAISRAERIKRKYLKYIEEITP
tara:strand:+ start:1010 stop:1531 length:522 start_codon:yes stop_codon:yes gene_type:complete